MSRTYRKGMEWRLHANGKFYTWDEYDVICGAYRRLGFGRWWEDKEPYPCHGWTYVDIPSKKCRDGKHNNGVMGSAPKWYKDIRRRRQRRQVRQAIHHERDIPKFKKDDAWYW